MGFYGDVVIPKLCAMAMRNERLVPYRRRVVGAAEGRVLEIGIGSGMNLPYYGAAVREVVGIEPSARLREMTRQAATGASVAVSLIEGSAEAMPLDAMSFDTVLTSWTLCSIADARRALGEMRRVLKPGGRLLFVEHGMAPDRGVLWWQDVLTPAWSRLSGGCHLNRPIRALVEGAGFRCERLDTGYMPGPRPMTFMYEGSARPG